MMTRKFVPWCWQSPKVRHARFDLRSGLTPAGIQVNLTDLTEKNLDSRFYAGMTKPEGETVRL